MYVQCISIFRNLTIVLVERTVFAVCLQVAKNGGGVSAANQVAYTWAQNLGKTSFTGKTIGRFHCHNSLTDKQQ